MRGLCGWCGLEEGLDGVDMNRGMMVLVFIGVISLGFGWVKCEGGGWW